MRILALFLALWCGACTSVPALDEAGHEIGSEAVALLLDRPDTLVLDVRSPDEALAGDVPQAEKILFGPLRWTERPVSPEDVENFLGQVREKFPDKETALVVFCNLGIRSRAATAALLADGYRNAQAVKQGFLGNTFGPGLEYRLLAR